MTLFVLENTEKPRLTKLFTLLDVDVMATSTAWLGVVWTLVIGVVVSLISAPVDGLLGQILVGLVFGLIFYASTFAHGLGHILSSRMVHAPMQQLIFTATIPITRYDDAPDANLPRRVHIGRSLGGPEANLVLVVAGIVLYVLLAHSPFFVFLAVNNAVFLLVTLSPIPTLDGAVIWRELRRPSA